MPSRRLDQVVQWVDERFPLSALYDKHLREYFAPKNFNIWYVFGANIAYQTGPQRWSFCRKGEVEHIEINGRLAVNNSDVLRETVLGGLGIALLPQWLIKDDVRSGRLRRLFEEYDVNPQDQNICVYAAYLPNRRHSRKVHSFLDFLQMHVTTAIDA